MFYNWKCCACGELTEVERRLADIDIRPDACNSCSNTTFEDERVLVPTLYQNKHVKQFILADTGVGWAGHGFYNKVPERKR